MRPLLSTLIAGALFTTAQLAPAQKIQNYGSGGFGLSSTYAKLYDTTKSVTFAGRITGITVGSPINGAGNSVRIVVKTKDGGSSLVEVGPQWYVNNQRVKLHVRDRVTVRGSKVVLDGRGSIMAARISKGNQTLVLRDTAGRPFWDATAFAVRPAFVTGTTPVQATVGTSAQSMTNPAPMQTAAATPQRVPLMPYNSNKTVFADPSQINGTVSNLAVNNGQVFASVALGGGGSQTVYLGPLWYLERQDFTINNGDTVLIDALTPVPNPNHVVYAERLSENGSSIVLRDDTGQEMWQPFVPTIVQP